MINNLGIAYQKNNHLGIGKITDPLAMLQWLLFQIMIMMPTLRLTLTIFPDPRQEEQVTWILNGPVTLFIWNHAKTTYYLGRVYYVDNIVHSHK